MKNYLELNSVELPFLTSIDEMSSDTLECVNDSAEPIKIIPVISMIKIENLDFFEDKCRVGSSKSKRVIHSNVYLFID
jgi:hypothetical protein